MKKRRKTVIAGNLVKVVEYTPTMPQDRPIIRSARRKATTAAQKALNQRTAQGRLEEKLACNFTTKDFFATFTYRPGEEPASRREATKHRKQYIRRLRTIRKRRGETLRYVFAIENKHGAGRFHAHAVISCSGTNENRDIEEIESLWDHGRVQIKPLFGRFDDQDEEFRSWMQIARYLTKERPDPEDGPDVTPVGAALYSCSQNLKTPMVINEWISEADSFQLPSSAIQPERDIRETEFSEYHYFKYLTTPIS